MRAFHFLLPTVLCTVVFLAPQTWAQENATITGTVADPTGAVIPGVTITLTNLATGQVRQGVSNTSGIYSISNLGVGHFNLEAAAAGFEKFTLTNIVLNTDQTLKEDVNLTVGNAAQTVTVQADALQVQSETSELSTLITGQQVSQLATNGRNVTSLAALGQQPVLFQWCQCAHLGDRNQLQWNTCAAQHLHVGWRRTERPWMRRLLQLLALRGCPV